MDDPRVEYDAPNDAAASYSQHVAASVPHLGCQTEDGCAPEPVSLATEKVAVIRIAQPRCGFDQRVEHRLQIEGRPADDLEHVARRGLVFKRLFEVAGALAQFAEQPRVLHRDDRLRREVLQQRDLLVGERADLLAINGEQRRVARRPCAAPRSSVRTPPRSTTARQAGSLAVCLRRAQIGNLDERSPS